MDLDGDLVCDAVLSTVPMTVKTVVPKEGQLSVALDLDEEDQELVGYIPEDAVVMFQGNVEGDWGPSPVDPGVWHADLANLQLDVDGDMDVVVFREGLVTLLRIVRPQSANKPARRYEKRPIRSTLLRQQTGRSFRLFDSTSRRKL